MVYIRPVMSGQRGRYEIVAEFSGEKTFAKLRPGTGGRTP
jgi:hypothetical protein